MAQHIGIVACSAEGAALCYRSICVGGADLLGPHDHPEISMHTHSLAEYMKCIDRDDWQGVGELMLSSANKLAKIGADFLICPDNTIHQVLPHIEGQLPLKWLHIAEAVAAQAAGRRFRRLGLTGTRYLVESDVYPEKLKAVATFQRVMERMKNEGCDAVVLGCTEIPLLMNDANSPLPTLDSTRLLARAALRRAVQTKAVQA
jgi:aspartate racemase